MKIQLSILALLNSSVLMNGALAQSQQDMDEWEGEYNQYAEEGEDEEIIYDTEAEKAAWIYGVPGEEGYKEPDSMSEEEYNMLDGMWEIDHTAQKYRGLVQGWYRGYYKDYDWELQEKCFDKDSVMMMWHVKDLTSRFDINEIMNFQGLLFQLYFMFDHECTIDKMLHDLANFCFDHDCSGEKLLQNEMSNVFMVVGALNQLAAIYYDPMPPDDAHMALFDVYSDIGKAIGKLARYTMAFDPKEVYDW